MKILIAEDEEDMRKVLVKGLKAEGYKAEGCENGEEALARVLAADYDLIILDIMMPVMDGLTALKSMRANDVTSPVIMLTAKDTIDDKVTGLDAGANDYIVKPFAFEELLTRIRAVKRTESGSISDIITVANLSLDTKSHIVKRDETEISFTGKEYNLLEYLMINHGQIISRAKILDHVWGYEYDGGMKIVDVYMNYVRKKVDENYEPKLIHTVRGIGYVLREENEK
ncbi:MAG: response regulator transcription factor [Catonella sp.]|nr:response regulator transcription factor [Catonella sp.]MDY6356204.1 response regulator transcription factor [Catonella sp.]